MFLALFRFDSSPFHVFVFVGRQEEDSVTFPFGATG